MKVTPIHTTKILAGEKSIFEILDESLEALSDESVLVVTSKIVSLAEGSVVPLDGTREALIVAESNQYLPKHLSAYGHHFTITDHTLIAGAGIDESNGDDHYVLWPRDAQKSANEIRQYLLQRFNLQKVGVIITDSTSQPLRRGTTGIVLAHSGFEAVRDYRGTKDLFDHDIVLSIANVSGGLAAAAVVAMGEGTEQTPLCLLEDLPFVTFQDRNPSDEELAFIHLDIANDLFAPFLQNVPWQSGRRKTDTT